MKLTRKLFSRISSCLSSCLSSRLISRLIIVIIGGCLLLLLTSLFRQTQVLNVNQHYQIISHLRGIERANLVLINDALKTKLAIVHNYDALVADRLAFHQQFTELQKALSPTLKNARSLQQSLPEKLTNVETQEIEQNILVEDIKSKNSVLQNSIRYFPNGMETLLEEIKLEEIKSEQIKPEHTKKNKPHPQVKSQLKSLLANVRVDVLRYNTDQDPNIANRINQQLAQIEALPVSQSEPWQAPITNISRHAQAILRLQPELSHEIDQLVNSPLTPAINQLALAYEDYHRQITYTQNRYRLWLYMISLVLVIGLLYFAWYHRNAAVMRKVNHHLGQLVTEKTQALEQTLEQLKVSQTQLVQAEKMSALGQLSAGIAHEINNPISFIHGNLTASEQYSQDCLELISLYEQHYPNPPQEIQDLTETIDLDFLKADWVQLLHSMQTGTTRVKKIVESLRNFSRLDEANYKVVNLHEGLESTLLMLNHQLTESNHSRPIEVIRNYGDLPTVLCDSGAINQVFMNILSNAIDAFKPEHPAPIITITTQAETDQVIIAITDNGEGIPPAIQSKIFDPFFTSKPVGKGTGLGLTISYQTIVKAHNGQIDVTSTPGKGTEFQIRLPLPLSPSQPEPLSRSDNALKCA